MNYSLAIHLAGMCFNGSIEHIKTKKGWHRWGEEQEGWSVSYETNRVIKTCLFHNLLIRRTKAKWGSNDLQKEDLDTETGR